MADFTRTITDPLGADDTLAPVYSGVVAEGGLGATDSTSADWYTGSVPVVPITQAAYDALGPGRPNVLYVRVVEE